MYPIKDKVIIDNEEPFVDERGIIQPIVDVDLKSAVLITSKKGSIRANHYHKTDWHYCTVLTGSIRYYWRPVGLSIKPNEVLIKKNQTFYTPPMVEHAMFFEEQTTFLTLGGNSRKQTSYENDLVRVKLI
tara:strand:- start:104 stop:493 length:390 start_codon:yes stop_codon:yes gene_type:complete